MVHTLRAPYPRAVPTSASAIDGNLWLSFFEAGSFRYSDGTICIMFRKCLDCVAENPSSSLGLIGWRASCPYLNEMCLGRLLCRPTSHISMTNGARCSEI